MAHILDTLALLLKNVERVGAYEFDRKKELGKGGFGTVYEGRELSNTRRKVAVKVMKLAENCDFQRELNMLKEISRLNHENFVQLLHSKEPNEESKEIILVMELCNEDMASYLRKKGKLPETSAAIFSRQIVRGLKVLESHRIIHRDLKPQNLLLTYREQNPKPEDIIVKIADFGLARFLPNDYYQKMTQCGTVCYMAPEAMVSDNYNSKADIWSVGLIIHEMLIGPLPFLNLFLGMMQNYECPKSLSSQAQDLLNRMLKRNPVERIDIKSLIEHPFLEGQTPREKLIEEKNKYLPERMTRVEKQKLYTDAVGLPDIPTWYDVSSTTASFKPIFGINDDLNRKVSIWKGDITKIEVDAVVNPTNTKLENSTSGANKEIHNAAGPQLDQEAKGLIGGCDFGSAVVTAGYNLPAYYVIHTVGPYNHDGLVLSSCYESCLQKILDLKIRSVAFTAIATGNYKFPVEEATQIALKNVREWLEAGNNVTQVDRVIFVCFSTSTLEAYNKYMPLYFPKVGTGNHAAKTFF